MANARALVGHGINTSVIIKTEEIWAKVRYKTNPQDVQAPSIAKIAHGFDYGEKPSHATFNWVMYKVMGNAVAQQQQGILYWDSTIDYDIGAVTQYVGPKEPAGTLPFVYQAIKGKDPKVPNSVPNKGHAPEGANIGVWWKKGIEDSSDYVKKRGQQSPEDPSGGLITGDIIITANAKLIIEA